MWLLLLASLSLPIESVGEDLTPCLFPLGSTAPSWVILKSMGGTWSCTDLVYRCPVTCPALQ